MMGQGGWCCNAANEGQNCLIGWNPTPQWLELQGCFLPLAFASAAAAAVESTGRRANSQSPPLYCIVSGSRASKVEHEVPDRATCVGAPPLTTAQSYLSVALEELPGRMDGRVGLRYIFKEHERTQILRPCCTYPQPPPNRAPAIWRPSHSRAE